MANNIAWQPTSFSPVNINPSLGFASAAKAFSNIQSNLQDKEAAESLAAYRAASTEQAQQELEYKLGAEDRAIAEEERLLGKSIEGGLFAEQAAKEAGGSRVESLLGSILQSEDPRLQGVEDIEGKLAAFADTNKAAVSDPTVYHDTLLNNLMKGGKHNYEDARKIATEKTTKLFPTMSDDMIKTMMTASGKAPGRGGSGDGAGGTGTFKPWSKMPSVMDESEIHKNFMEMYPVGKGENASIFGVELDYTGPFGAVDVTGPDIRKLSTSMKQEGINPAATYAVVEKYIQGNNLNFDPVNMTPAQKAAFISDAEQVMAQQGQGYNSKTGALTGGGTGAQAQQDYYGQLDKILTRGTTKKLSDDELLSQFLGTLGDAQPAIQPAVTPAPAVQTPGILPPAADVAPAVPAETPGIMPAATVPPQMDPSVPAMMGNAVKTGLEVNAEGVKILKWLSDQTGQGAIDLVKSFKNAPEWLAEFQKGYQQ